MEKRKIRQIIGCTTVHPAIVVFVVHASANIDWKCIVPTFLHRTNIFKCKCNFRYLLNFAFKNRKMCMLDIILNFHLRKNRKSENYGLSYTTP